jgi:hypothetical protein
MLTLLRIANVVLLLALVGCLAGALAGLIVLAPVVGGAWLLNLAALAGYEEHARPGWIERIHTPVPGRGPEPAPARLARPEPTPQAAKPVPRINIDETLPETWAA